MGVPMTIPRGRGNGVQCQPRNRILELAPGRKLLGNLRYGLSPEPNHILTADRTALEVSLTTNLGRRTPQLGFRTLRQRERQICAVHLACQLDVSRIGCPGSAT